MKNIETLLALARELGWTVRVDSNPNDPTIDFQQYSAAGQDFNFFLRPDNKDIDKADPEALILSLERYVNDYDPSEEALKWTDESGHGRNGAPHDLKDIIEDMEDCKSMMNELLDAWRNGAVDKGTKSHFDTLKERLDKHTDSFENPGNYKNPSGPAEIYDTLLAIKTLIEIGTLVENPDQPLTDEDLNEIPL